jgi:uncharacterized membrane protein (Fun14 family)
MNTADRAYLGLAVLAGCFIAYVELHTTEVTATLGLLIVVGLFLGFARRRLFWLWAVVIGASVPVAYVAAVIFNITPRELPQPEGIITDVLVGAFTVAASMIAAAIGAMIARSVSRTA